MQSPTNLLLTGPSGVGKSTLLKEVGIRLRREGHAVRGFVSEAITDGSQRIGWRLDSFERDDGGVLAHLELASEHSMGRYGVDMSLFDRLVATELATVDESSIYLIDEIGLIGEWSPLFSGALDALLASHARVVAAIRARGDGLVLRIKERSDVETWEMTARNRDRLADRVLRWLTESRTG